MSDLESKLMPEDKDWLSGTYKTTEEAFAVAEYFARYVRKRWPKRGNDDPANDRGHLYIELVDVDFRKPCPFAEVLVQISRLCLDADES